MTHDALRFRDTGGYSDGFDFIGTGALGPTLEAALQASPWTHRIWLQWRTPTGEQAENTTVASGYVFPDGSCFVLWPGHDVWYIFSTGTRGFSCGIDHQFREDGAPESDGYLTVVQRP